MKLSCGVGVNDANYNVYHKENGKVFICPYYSRWRIMLQRCYCEKYQEKNPTYKGCLICDEWLVFSNFREWMMPQDWEGKQLDKDILSQGNKIYCPEMCLFVTCEVNNLILGRSVSNGDLPIGVRRQHGRNKYSAFVNLNGKTKYIGSYESPIDAGDAYKKEKYLIIKDVAMKQVEPLRTALLNFKIAY